MSYVIFNDLQGTGKFLHVSRLHTLIHSEIKEKVVEEEEYNWKEKLKKATPEEAKAIAEEQGIELKHVMEIMEEAKVEEAELKPEEVITRFKTEQT